MPATPAAVSAGESAIGVHIHLSPNDPRKCSKYTSSPSGSALNAAAAASVRCIRPERTLCHQRSMPRSVGVRRRIGSLGRIPLGLGPLELEPDAGAVEIGVQRTPVGLDHPVEQQVL